MALTKITEKVIADASIKSTHLHGSHGITTSHIGEGSNEYHTTARARAAVSVGGSLAYNSSTGVVSFTQRTDGTIRGLVSVTDSGGDGSLAYNNSTGVITYTGPSAAEVRAHISAGSGITVSSGAISIANDAIDSQHYAAGSIDLEHMSANSIDSTQYVDGSIDLVHMSANSVDSDQYVDGSIDLAHMSDNSIDSDQYVDGSIDTAHIAASQITNALMADNAIDSAEIVAGSIDTAHIADDQITAAKLANTAVTAASYGSSTAVPVVTIDAQGRITAASTAAISSSLTVGADSGTDDVVTIGTDTLDFVGTSNQISTTVSNNQIQIGFPTDVTISGDLTVSGDTTTVNTATLAVEDPLVSLATGNNAADAVDIGIYGLYDTSGSQDLYGGIFRDASDSGKWKLFKDNQAAPTTTVNTSGTGYAVGSLVANLEGNVTGNVTGDVTGNTSGTAATVTGATQAAITTTANLVTVGTIGTGVWQGTAIATGYIAADAIDGTKIADNAIDSEHYTDASIDLAHMSANSVDSTQYVDGSIDLVHMSANSVDSAQYVDGSIDLAHMSANSIDSDQYVDGSIDTAHIAASQITNALMADDAIDSAEIADGAIDLAHMSVNSVDSDQYVDGSIDLIHMSANSIDSDQYVDGSIDTAHIAADQITSALIADDQIDSEHYVDGSIDAAHLAPAQTNITSLGTLSSLAVSGDGSVANLSVADDISHTGDSDTYLSWNANNLSIYNGGTQNAYFDASSTTFNDQGGGVDFRVESANQTHMLFVNGSADSLAVGGTQSNTINSSTAYDPAASVTPHLSIINSNGSDGSGVNNFSTLEFEVASGATSRATIALVRTGDNAGALAVGMRNTSGGSGFAEKMRIVSDGKVGIGTTTPAELLHISGSSASIEVSSSGDGATLVLNNIDGTVTGDWGIKNRNGDGRLGFSRSDGSGSDLVVITTTGRLGINDTSPSYTLDVDGDINFTGTLREDGTEFSGGISAGKAIAMAIVFG